MATASCPSCGAAVRPGDPWCTLCWADLRPKPTPPPPPPAPAPVPAPVPAPAAAMPAPAPLAVAAPAVDPLTAPLPVLLGEQPAPAPAADPDAVPATWPCVECGAANALDHDACGTCAAPFGGRFLRDDPKEKRRKVLIYSLAALGAFLVLFAVLVMATTHVTPNPADPDGVVGQPFSVQNVPEG